MTKLKFYLLAIIFAGVALTGCQEGDFDEGLYDFVNVKDAALSGVGTDATAHFNSKKDWNINLKWSEGASDWVTFPVVKGVAGVAEVGYSTTDFVVNGKAEERSCTVVVRDNKNALLGDFVIKQTSKRPLTVGADLDSVGLKLVGMGEGLKGNIKLLASEKWTLEGAIPAWLTVLKTSGGKEDGKIEFTADEFLGNVNEDEDDRVAEFIIKTDAGTQEVEVTVVQKAKLYIEKIADVKIQGRVVVPPAEDLDSAKVVINSLEPWTIVSDQSWVTLSEASGKKGTTEIMVYVADLVYHSAGALRTANVTITSTNGTQKFLVGVIPMMTVKIPADIVLNSTLAGSGAIELVPISATIGVGYTTLTANVLPEVVGGDTSWLTVTVTGNRVDYAYADNAGGMRAAFIEFVTDGKPAFKVKVTQPAK